MIDYKLALMAGIDIPIPEFQLVVHVPIVKDIAYMGEREFFTAVQYICLEKEFFLQDKTLLKTMSNFQVLMKVLGQTQDKEKKSIISTLLTILFPGYKPVITPRSIVLNPIDETGNTVMLDDNNFEMFKGILKEILCVNNLFQRDNIVYNPKGQLATEIANKLMKGRLKAAELKSKKQSGESVLVRYISILSVAGVASLKDCLEYNIFQIFDLIERYTAFVEWDTDLKIRLQGGKPDKEVESWMRDLHSQKSTAFSAKDIPSGMKVY